MTLGETAHAYTDVGLYVFPCRPQDKRPATRRGVHDATRDPAQIDRWWAENPAYNIGIACGPSGLLVVDLDGPEGIRAWLDLVGDGRPLGPATATVFTPGSGAHMYFAGRGRNTVGVLGPGIDTRGEGGYVIAPPSIHPNGDRYAWADPTVPIQPAPAWLVEALAPAAPRRVVPTPPAPGPLPDGATGTSYGVTALLGLLDDLAGAQPGTRNATLFRTAARVAELIAAGHLAAADTWWRVRDAAAASGLPADEIARTIASAQGRVTA